MVTQKEILEEERKEFYYVDYCNGCKVDFLNKYNIPCHHPWYCWQEGKTSELQYEIVELEIKKNPTAYDKNRLKELKNERYHLIREILKKEGKPLQLIKKYLSAHTGATSRQLAVYLSSHYGLNKTYNAMDVSRLIKRGMENIYYNQWFHVEAIENTSPKQWRLTK